MNLAEFVELLNDDGPVCACCGEPVSLFADFTSDESPTGFTFRGSVYCLDCIGCLQAKMNKPHPLTLKKPV